MKEIVLLVIFKTNTLKRKKIKAPISVTDREKGKGGGFGFITSLRNKVTK